MGRVESVLKGADFHKKLVGRSHDGLAIQPLYHRRPEAQTIAGDTAGLPWTVMAQVDHPVAEEAARLALEDLEGGADALALVFPGGRSARGYGIACNTLTDLDAALNGIRLELIKLRLDPAPAGRIHALMLAALVERRKLAPEQMQIDFGMDPIATLTNLGMVPWDWPSMAARLGETVNSLLERGFTGPFLTVDLRPYHEAGASEGQELSAGLAQGVLYLRALEAQGIPLTKAATAISFVVPVDADQFLGIAKLRALRMLWARTVTACGLPPQPLRIHAETSWRMLSKRDAHVNFLRSTIATFAASIGGADSVTVLPFTSALGLPEAQARRLARNTSIVLMEESNLWRVVDPAAGAGAYETLTEDLASKAWALFKEIEREGGLVSSLTSGKLQGRISQTAQARMRAVATRKEPLTGTSEFANLTEVPPDVLNISPSQQVVPKAKATAHSGNSTADVITALAHGASRNDVTPPIMGRLAAASLTSYRVAEPFEALRDRSDAILRTTGKRPRVTVLTLGPLADHAARLAFTRNLFEAGGVEVNILAEFGMPVTGLICLVGSDAAYAAEALDRATALIARGCNVWLAAKPGSLDASLTATGAKCRIFAGCDSIDVLTEVLHVANP